MNADDTAWTWEHIGVAAAKILARLRPVPRENQPAENSPEEKPSGEAQQTVG